MKQNNYWNNSINYNNNLKTKKLMKKKLSLLMIAFLGIVGISFAAIQATVLDLSTSADETTTVYLTKENINAQDYLSVSADKWATGKTYDGVTGDFYNMSSTDRTLSINVKGVSKFEVIVYNTNAGRDYVITVGDGDSKTITHPGGGLVSSGVIETGTTDEVTIKIGGGGQSVYPVKFVLTKAEGGITVPSLKATPKAIAFALNPSKQEASETFTLTGKNLTDGSYTLTVPNLAGLSVTPQSFTVANGAVNQEFTVTYASREDVAKATTEISATVGDLTATVEVTYQSRATAYTQSTVSAEATWDWSKLSEEIKLTEETSPNASEEFLLADLDDRITFNEAFGDPTAIMMSGMQYPSRTGFAQGTTIKFKTSVPGTISVEFSNTGGGNDRPDRYLNVNGENTEFKSNSTTKVTATGITVPAGEVVLMGNEVNNEATNGFKPNMLRWYKITFTPSEEPVPSLYLLGDIASNGWDLTKMDELTFNTTAQAYEYEFEARGTVNFTFSDVAFQTEDWDSFNSTHRYGLGNGNVNATLDEPLQLLKGFTGDPCVRIQDPGKYKMTITKDLKLTITKTGDVEDTYVVAGGYDGQPAEEESPLFGISWDASRAENQLEKQNDGTYKKVYENVTLGAGTITYKIVKNGTTWIPDGDNLTCAIPSDGNYTITVTFDPQTNTATMEAAQAGQTVTTGFRDIKVTLADADKWKTLVENNATVYITVDADGTIGTTDDATKAAATLTGKWHGTSYGWSNFTAEVPVEGCVKITYATHDYGQDIIVTDDAGNQVAKLNTEGAKWSADPANVVVGYYRTNKPTTLHFSQANYNPYFAVEAIDEADLPAEVTKYTVTFAAGEGTGVVPADLEVDAGNKINAPKNYTLYKEGATLTGWQDATGKTYAIGEEITPEADLALTAVYTQNEVSLADRTAAVTITYALDGYNDNPKYNFERNNGFIVTQATVNGKSIDVKVDVDATAGKFAHNGSGWHQVNAGTKVTVPSCKDAVINVTTYQNANALKFGETAAEAGATATYTATAEDETLVITQTAQGYWSNLTITLPKVEGDEPVEPQPHDPVTLTWSYDEENPIPTTGPDNGLYFASYVNDAAGTNNGMHGVKLNSSGYAFFEKPAVEGTLTLTFGNRKATSAYAVNVYACTVTDGTATKGELIGEVSVAESPGTGSIDIAADVTGIYIERKTSAEGVLQKIVFKEKVPRTFVDFEITNDELKGTIADMNLPQGVTLTGTQPEAGNNAHGYINASISVPTDGGAVKFTFGGCQYANKSFTVTNSNNETIATLSNKTTNCYHQDASVVTYFYTGEATTLTFSTIPYLPYFKAEATDVQEVTVTFKDQNGNVLGTTTVFEGEALGEVPFTEADLTIPSGQKFRGWTYTNGVKVKATDVVDGPKSVIASVTAIETTPEVGSVQTYDLTKQTFYPEDHENFNVTDGKYYNNHGFDFAAGGSFDVAVGGNAQVVLALCEYGNGTTVTVTDAQGKTIASDVTAKAESGKDGATTTINYEGAATTLTFTFATQTYLHSVKVFNVNSFVEQDAESGYYIVPAGDAAALVLAINAAASTPNSKIFLPNGTYDLGETVLTGISGTNVSIIGESMEGVIIKNAPPTSMEGLEKADLFINTSTGLYMQDLTLQNALDYYNAGSNGRAVTLHDKGTQTINKNVRHLSYQDTYYSHKVGGLFYFEGGEIHGTVDFLCGNGKAYFNEVTIVTEKRSSATISANSELYVFNNCTVKNNADKYNFGRAWSDSPVCVWLNTTLEDGGEKLEATRWNLTGINCDYSIAGEYGTKDAEGTDITPASNDVTFKKFNTSMNTILDASALDTYSIENVLGSWAATAQEQATQVEAPTATLEDGTIKWDAVSGATAYAIFKDGELLTIVGSEATSYTIEESTSGAPSLEGDTATPVYTLRAANERGGFGEPKEVTVADGINRLNIDQNGDVKVYDLNGRRIMTPTTGVYIVNGKKVVIK